jgi:hypothetical protein
MQEEEMENVKTQLNQANSETILVLQSAILAMKEQEEESNRKMEENLGRAASKKRQRVRAAPSIGSCNTAYSQQLTYPQFYGNAPPPSYQQQADPSQDPQWPQYPIGYPGANNSDGFSQARTGVALRMGLAGAGALAMGCNIL